MSEYSNPAAEYYASHLLLTDQEAIEFTAPHELMSTEELRSGIRLESIQRNEQLLAPSISGVFYYLHKQAKIITRNVENNNNGKFSRPFLEDYTAYVKSNTEVLWNKKANKKLVTGKVSSITIQAVLPESVQAKYTIETPAIPERLSDTSYAQDIADDSTDSYYLLQANTKVGRFVGSIACGIKMKSHHVQYLNPNSGWTHRFGYEMAKLNTVQNSAIDDTQQSKINARLQEAWSMSKPFGGMHE